MCCINPAFHTFLIWLHYQSFVFGSQKIPAYSLDCCSIPQLNAPPLPAPQYQLQISQVLLHFQPVCEGFHRDLEGQEEQLNQGAVQGFVIQDEVS
jgi:hypothetical protein